MKRAVIGGFLSLIGSIWTLSVVFIAGNNLVDGWSTPPGRLLTTITELGLTFLFAIFILLVIVGILIMIVEFFRKAEK